MKNQQAFNPYLPSFEYIPDGEARVFDGRVYVYGSHDKYNGISFCLNDYVCWSAPVDNLADWRYEGVIWKKSSDPGKNRGFLNSMFAPDVVKGMDGKYYLYYFIGYKGHISVAVCDTPAGEYRYLGKVKYSDGTELGKKGEPLQFDPGVFVDGDGKVYLYTGFGPVNYPKFLMGGKRATIDGAMCFELEPDMITIKGGLRYIGVPAKPKAQNTDYAGHSFFEAASMRKFDGKYYFVYSSELNHELCYAVSDKPDRGFKYGGTLVSICDAGLYDTPRNYTGNTHGSLAKINGKYYVFYHRQTNRHSFSRQACAEEIRFENGRFYQAETTSCGLNGAPLAGAGEYEARTACQLYSKKGTYYSGVFKKRRGCYPYFTQSGVDRETNPDQYIANFCDGAVAGYKYFDIKNTKIISVSVRGNPSGVLHVSGADDNTPFAEIQLSPSRGKKTFSAPLSVRDSKNKTTALFFKYRGSGRFDFISFSLS